MVIEVKGPGCSQALPSAVLVIVVPEIPQPEAVEKQLVLQEADSGVIDSTVAQMTLQSLTMADMLHDEVALEDDCEVRSMEEAAVAVGLSFSPFPVG